MVELVRIANAVPMWCGWCMVVAVAVACVVGAVALAGCWVRR